MKLVDDCRKFAALLRYVTYHPEVPRLPQVQDSRERSNTIEDTEPVVTGCEKEKTRLIHPERNLERRLSKRTIMDLDLWDPWREQSTDIARKEIMKNLGQRQGAKLHLYIFQRELIRYTETSTKEVCRYRNPQYIFSSPEKGTHL